MGLEELPEYLIDKLPSNFHNVSYHFQHSASAGIKEGVASLHLWFMLSNPMNSIELKEWHEGLPKKQKQYIDESMFRPVQVNYTANPVFIGVDDPVKIPRSGLVKKLLPAVTLTTKPKKVKPVKNKTPIQKLRQALTEHTGEPMNAFYKKVKDIGERGHLPILSAFSTYKWACNTKGEQESQQWAIQKVKEQLVGTAYNVPPYNTDNYLNNQYRDAR